MAEEQVSSFIPSAQVLILSNSSGKRNLGSLIRSASAFNCAEAIVVGSQKFGTHGAHGAQKYVKITCLPSYKEAKLYLSVDRGYTVIGIQAIPGRSTRVDHANFKGRVGFLVPNETGILTKEQLDICDSFVHLPTFSQTRVSFGTTKLGMVIASSIAMYHFSRAAGYSQRRMAQSDTRGKFELDPSALTSAHLSALRDTDDALAMAKAREQKKEQRLASRVAAANVLEDDGTNLFGAFGVEEDE